MIFFLININTRNKIIQLRKENPRWTLQKIANESGGISKQRVWSILKSENLPTKMFNRSLNINRYKNCHFCKSIMPRGTGSNYCNSICRENDLFINYPCSLCHKNMRLNKNIMLNKVQKLQQYNFFCTKKCYGQYRTKNKKT